MPPARSHKGQDDASGPGERPRTGQLVPSVVRAADLLDALASGPSTATLASLSRRLELPRSSTLALCNTLVQAGLMTRGRDGYRLGPRVVTLSRAYLTQTDLHTEFNRVARGLAVLPEETLVLSVRDATEVVYIGRRIGSRPVGVSYEVGLRLPAHCTASGKALLSALPEEEVRELYGPETRLSSLTPRSITDVPALMRDLSKVSDLGYAVDDEETAPGMTCVGVAIRDRTGRGVGAVAVSMVKAAMTDGALTLIAGEMRHLADRISTALGAHEIAATGPG